jgi:hypothetical protein
MPTIITWLDDAGATESARFDVLMNESHEATSVVTEHPVEEGQSVVDHVRPEPDRLSLTGYVSAKPLFRNPGAEDFMAFEQIELDLPEKDSPFARGQLTRGITSAIENAIDPLPTKATVIAYTDLPPRPREMYERLRDARDNVRIVRIETPIREYENMVIERLAAPRSADDGTGATFQIDLKNIRRVTSRTVQAPVPAEPRGQLTQSQGSKSAEAAKNDEEKEEKLQSIMARAFDGAGNALQGIF